jgi:perosamine synthetase
MLVAGIGPGDEVIVPAFTIFATASSVAMCGATPIFADVDGRTFNLDLAVVTEAITPKTRAIMGVHLFGQPFDIAGIQEGGVGRERLEHACRHRSGGEP